jgi:hypothetical protein
VGIKDELLRVLDDDLIPHAIAVGLVRGVLKHVRCDCCKHWTQGSCGLLSDAYIKPAWFTGKGVFKTDPDFFCALWDGAAGEMLGLLSGRTGREKNALSSATKS